jgi:hypothetical protein
MEDGDTYRGDDMRTKFFAALLGCCTLTAAVASDRQNLAPGLQDFPGQYDLVDGRLLTITQRGQRLIMQLDNQPEAEIVAVGSAAFEAKYSKVRLEFIQHPNGNVPAVRVIYHSNTRPAACQTSVEDLHNRSCIAPTNMSSPNAAPLPRIN